MILSQTEPEERVKDSHDVVATSWGVHPISPSLGAYFYACRLAARRINSTITIIVIDPVAAAVAAAKTQSTGIDRQTQHLGAFL